jgi:hypothetical protein
MIYANAEDLSNLRGELRPIVDQQATSIAQCSTLSQAEAQNFGSFKARFDDWYARTAPLAALTGVIWVAPPAFALIQAEYGNGQALKREAQVWQDTLAHRQCKNLAPPVPNPDKQPNPWPDLAWWQWTAIALAGVFVVNAATGGYVAKKVGWPYVKRRYLGGGSAPAGAPRLRA